MSEVSQPPPEYLRQRLRYEPETGKLYWRAHPSMPNNWNTRWAGREAFTADHGTGYRQGTIDGRTHKKHRVVWAMVHGYWPVEVDHEDHDKSGNRLSNLREADRSINCRNTPRRADNTSGVTGVYWNAARGAWHATITARGQRTHLGLFDSLEEATAARRAAEPARGFHANHGAAR